jgi:cobyrinic acid a,c-diamide synthase
VSIPRIMLAPTHATGLADCVAAVVVEIAAAAGHRVRYHHLGPLSPVSAWDRWEGAAFLDPDLYDQQALLALYDVATRGAGLSLLSSSTGVLDRCEGAGWRPADVALLLDCPVIVVVDCRGWGAGIRALLAGLRAELTSVDLAGVLLSGLADDEHCEAIRVIAKALGLPVVGCLMQGDGPAWDTPAPGPWGLPLDDRILETVARQVDVGSVQSLAGQRGFLTPQAWLSDRGAGGPLVMVAGGKGFTPWSRDSIEVLRSGGAQIRRLDLIEDHSLPPEASGLVLAGTIWPADLIALAANELLLRDVRERIETGLPTVALGGGMLYLLQEVQDSLGRTARLAGVLPGQGEILWDLETATYVQVAVQRDSILFAAGDTVVGWVATECELPVPARAQSAPFVLRADGATQAMPEGVMTDTLLCSRAFVHLAGTLDRGQRFVRRCARYALEHNLRAPR